MQLSASKTSTIQLRYASSASVLGVQWLTAVLTMSRHALMSVDAPLEYPRLREGRGASDQGQAVAVLPTICELFTTSFEWWTL